MKKLFGALLGLILVTTAFGEPITLSGKIIDATTGNPVSFANIAIIGLQKGTTSLENGDFTLTIDDKDTTNNINISCINYKNKTFALESLDFNKPIQLVVEPITYEISEVIIKPKKHDKDFVLNKLKTSEINGGLSCGNIPKIYARYFPYNSIDEGYNTISSIQVYCQSWSQKGESKVRLRIYQLDTILKQPASDILHKELIVSLKKGKINNIELSEQNIVIPKEGLFIAIEWLIIPENKYEWISEDRNGNKIRKFEYGPILGANYREESNTWLYWAGKWTKEFVSVPAIQGIKKGLFYDAGISITITE